jgi:hypothetical protein
MNSYAAERMLAYFGSADAAEIALSLGTLGEPEPEPAWPHRTLYSGTPAQARRLADKLRLRLGEDPERWLKPGGFEVKRRVLCAASGELEALCIPLEHDRFRFVIDSAHPADATCKPDAATLQARYLFRLCHEIAHTFFYSRIPGRRPHHLGGSSEWEERFCDAFARRLTGLREPPARLKG